MKTNSIFALFMLAAVFAFGQEKIQEVKVTPPKFTGVANTITTMKDGNFGSIDDYMVKNIIYPEKDVKNFNQGTEVVQFVVSPTGELTDFTIINTVSPQFNEEVIRVLKTTNGMWVPGFNNSNPVAMEKEVSVVFKIEGTRFTPDFKTQASKHFSKGGEVFLAEHNPKKALKHYDKGILLLPSDESLLLMRGMARYETGDKDGAIRDWERIKMLGGNLNDDLLGKISSLKGYEELTHLLSE